MLELLMEKERERMEGGRERSLKQYYSLLSNSPSSSLADEVKLWRELAVAQKKLLMNIAINENVNIFKVIKWWQFSLPFLPVVETENVRRLLSRKWQRKRTRKRTAADQITGCRLDANNRFANRTPNNRFSGLEKLLVSCRNLVRPARAPDV